MFWKMFQNSRWHFCTFPLLFSCQKFWNLLCCKLSHFQVIVDNGTNSSTWYLQTCSNIFGSCSAVIYYHVMDSFHICKRSDRNRPPTGFLTFNIEVTTFKNDSTMFMVAYECLLSCKVWDILSWTCFVCFPWENKNLIMVVCSSRLNILEVLLFLLWSLNRMISWEHW